MKPMMKELNKVKDSVRRELIELSIPHRAEYVSMVRLTVTSIASSMGFDIESIEDMKVAVSEACSNAIRHGGCRKEDNFLVQFIREEKRLEINVSDFGKGYSVHTLKEPNTDTLSEGGLGIFIIKSLMDEVKIKTGSSQGTSIIMSKHLREED